MDNIEESKVAASQHVTDAFSPPASNAPHGLSVDDDPHEAALLATDTAPAKLSLSAIIAIIVCAHFSFLQC